MCGKEGLLRMEEPLVRTGLLQADYGLREAEKALGLSVAFTRG